MGNEDYRCTECDYRGETFIMPPNIGDKMNAFLSVTPCPNCEQKSLERSYRNYKMFFDEGLSASEIISQRKDDDDSKEPGVRDKRMKTGRANRIMMKKRYDARNNRLDDMCNKGQADRDRISKFMDDYGVPKNY